MRVLVLGNTGMLGHVAVRYLSEVGYDVVTLPPGIRFRVDNPATWIEAVARVSADVCINATGKTTKNSDSENDMFAVNSDLPRVLAEILPPATLLIHASSDGVFAPSEANRSVNDFPDAQDSYGLSKIRGEKFLVQRDNTVIIRTSIIGPDRDQPRNLLSWVIKQKSTLGQRTILNGFTNHAWNGVTSLRWAQICHTLVQNRQQRLPSLIQPGFVPAVSKFDLVSAITRRLRPNIEVIPTTHPCPIARTLEPTWPVPHIEKELDEICRWYGLNSSGYSF